jgi:hypothetical protein
VGIVSDALSVSPGGAALLVIKHAALHIKHAAVNNVAARAAYARSVLSREPWTSSTARATSAPSGLTIIRQGQPTTWDTQLWTIRRCKVRYISAVDNRNRLPRYELAIFRFDLDPPHTLLVTTSLVAFVVLTHSAANNCTTPAWWRCTPRRTHRRLLATVKGPLLAVRAWCWRAPSLLGAKR